MTFFSLGACVNYVRMRQIAVKKEYIKYTLEGDKERNCLENRVCFYLGAVSELELLQDTLIEHGNIDTFCCFSYIKERKKTHYDNSLLSGNEEEIAEMQLFIEGAIRELQLLSGLGYFKRVNGYTSPIRLISIAC